MSLKFAFELRTGLATLRLLVALLGANRAGLHLAHERLNVLQLLRLELQHVHRLFSLGVPVVFRCELAFRALVPIDTGFSATHLRNRLVARDFLHQILELVGDGNVHAPHEIQSAFFVEHVHPVECHVLARAIRVGHPFESIEFANLVAKVQVNRHRLPPSIAGN